MRSFPAASELVNIPRILFIALLLSAAANGTAQEVETGIESALSAQSGQWIEVEFSDAFTSGTPVVVIDPLFAEDSVSDVVVRDITADGFEFRFQSSSSASDPARLLRFSYIAAESGDYQLGNLQWSVGRITVSETTSTHSFPSSFSSAPVVVVQSDLGINGEVGLESVDSTAIEFAFAFGVDPVPPSITVDYIAIEAGYGSVAGKVVVAGSMTRDHLSEGIEDFAVPCPQPAVVCDLQSTNAPTPLVPRVAAHDPLGMDLRLADADGLPLQQASSEVIGYIAFAQGNLGGGEADSKLEIGELDLTQTVAGEWTSLPFGYSYEHPVVIVSPPSHGEPSRVEVKVRNVTSAGCEVQISEGFEGDGLHGTETCYWMVLESGSYEIGGIRWEAGTMVAGDEGESFRFSDSFETVPVVLAQVASDRNEAFAAAKISGIATDQIELLLQEKEENAPDHERELVHFLAVEKGKGVFSPETGLKFGVVSTAPPETPQSVWRKLKFDETYARPFFLAHAQSDDDPVPAQLRQRNLSERNVQMQVNENIADDEVREVGYLVFGDTVDSDEDGMPDVWEDKYGLNPSNSADATLNYDGDALNNYEEYLHGTNPLLDDSDGDGISDSDEAGAGLFFDPNDADSDSDFLGDGVEWEIIHHSSTDRFEEQRDVVVSDDFDGDGISNRDEDIAGTSSLDFYNGVSPKLEAIQASALGQSPPFAPPSEWLPHPCLLKVSDPAGSPLAGAPVKFVVSSGGGLIADASANPRSSVGTDQLILRSDEDGMIAIDWQMGVFPGESQTLLAFTLVEGEMELESFPAYSLQNGVEWELGSSVHLTAGRALQAAADEVTRWDSVGKNSNATFHAFGSAPSLIQASSSDPRSWVHFDGTQFVSSSEGIASDGTFFFVVQPDSATGLQTSQDPSSVDSRNYSLHGLTAAPDFGVEPGSTEDLGSHQTYPLGEQNYLLSGMFVDGLSPFQYLDEPAQAEAVYRTLSFYKHKDINNNKYKGKGLGMITREPLKPSVNFRYDVTNANRTNSLQNKVLRKKAWSFAQVINHFKNLYPASGHHWVTQNTWSWKDYTSGGTVIFREKFARIQRYVSYVPHRWLFTESRIGSVSPGLSIGNNGVGYFEAHSHYAPQLGGWNTGTDLSTGSPAVLAFRLPNDRIGELSTNGDAFVSGLEEPAGGTLGRWHTLGALEDGSQGFTGKLGELVVFLGAVSPETAALVEDRLAAQYSLALPDRDSDGIPDWWVRFLLAGSPSAADADGLDQVAELANGTHPLLADSDGDGIDDDVEISNGTDPLHTDSDRDGFPDGNDPSPLDDNNGRADFDGNGRSDGFDFLVALLGLDVESDLDGDGMDDDWEIFHGLDPADQNDGRGDEDGDGLTNFEEFTALTDPNEVDSDGDGLTDYQEVRSQYGLLPTTRHSDPDGLPDDVEWRIITALPDDGFASQLDVRPEDDFDLDGVSNYDEVDASTDPVDYYNGTPPLIASNLGANWRPPFVPAGEWLDRPMELLVTDGSGTPLANAPVEFIVSAGGGRILPYEYQAGLSSGKEGLLLRTNASGVAVVLWQMGTQPSMPQRLHALVRTGGQVKMETFLAYSALGEGILDDNAVVKLTPVEWSLSPLPGTGQLRWMHPLGSVELLGREGGAQPTLTTDPNTGLNWVQFARDGTGAGHSMDLSRFRRIDGDANGALEPVGEVLESVDSTWVGILAPDRSVPSETSPAPHTDAGRQVRNRGNAAEVGVWLSGATPSGDQSISPWFYEEQVPPEKMTSNYKFSKYVHKYFDDPVDNLYTPGKDSETNNQTMELRYDTTSASKEWRGFVKDASNPNKGSSPNWEKMRRKAGQSLGDIKDHFIGRPALSEFQGMNLDWRHELIGEYNASILGGPWFVEKYYRLEGWTRNQPAEWIFSAANVGSLSPRVSVGSTSAAAYLAKSSYSPPLYNRAFGGASPFVFTTGINSSREPFGAFDGAAISTGVAMPWGSVTPWKTIGTDDAGLRGYSGLLGAVAYFDYVLPENERHQVEDRLAALHGLDGPDRDADLIPDWFERFLSDPSLATAPGDHQDGDAWSLQEEFDAGTHPLLADSDGDGIPDDAETTTDPLHYDSDRDGFPDGMDPLPMDPANGNSDANGNGLPDGYEYLIAQERLVTIFNRDWDGDGIPDDWEAVYGLDPQNPLDFHSDDDGDGLSNRDEFRYGTDPGNADSDGDLVADGEEVRIYRSDPNSQDTDGDGLTDFEETQLGTSLFLADTDGDGYDDSVDHFPRDPQQHEFDPDPADVTEPTIVLESPAFAEEATP